MDNISFKIPIYTDAVAMFEFATKSDERFDVVDAVISQINQGDPVWEDINEEIKELFGEEACEYLDEDLEEYISYTGECEIDYEEMSAGDSDLLVYRVSCEFDVDKFAQKYNLEPVVEDKDIDIIETVNGINIIPVYANRLENGVYGDIYTSYDECKAEHPDQEVIYGYYADIEDGPDFFETVYEAEDYIRGLDKEMDI